MPPDPWKFLKTDELNTEQKKRLKKALQQRQKKLEQAFNVIEEALKTLSRSLSQSGKSTNSPKKRKARR